MTVHPRLSLSGVSTWNWSLSEDLAFCQRAGVPALGLSWRKLRAAGPDAIDRVRESGVAIGNIIETGGRASDGGASGGGLDNVIAAAVELGVPAVVITSGPPGDRSWEDAADRFVTTIGPHARAAQSAGVRLLLEHTNSFRVDLSFVHSLRDAVDLAARVDGVGVCLEINACWMERGLHDTVAGVVARGHLGLVQVSDFVVGTKCTPDRAVPGDGDIPLGRILRGIVGAGYGGRYDIELVGPRIEAEGYESAVTRSLTTLTALLTDAGA